MGGTISSAKYDTIDKYHHLTSQDSAPSGYEILWFNKKIEISAFGQLTIVGQYNVKNEYRYAKSL